jgi:hypothetical protein
VRWSGFLVRIEAPGCIAFLPGGVPRGCSRVTRDRQAPAAMARLQARCAGALKASAAWARPCPRTLAWLPAWSANRLDTRSEGREPITLSGCDQGVRHAEARDPVLACLPPPISRQGGLRGGVAPLPRELPTLSHSGQTDALRGSERRRDENRSEGRAVDRPLPLTMLVKTGRQESWGH